MYPENISQKIAVHGLQSTWDRSYIHYYMKRENIINLAQQRKTMGKSK